MTSPSKRGRKKGQLSPGAKMDLRDIAKILGISNRTASTDLSKAKRKISEIPGAWELIIRTVHALAAEEEFFEHDLMQPTSIECRVARGEYIP